MFNHDPRLEGLARVLVRYSVAVKKGQVVKLAGPTLSEPLIVALYREVIRIGGRPIVRLSSEVCEEILLKEGTSEQIDYIYPLDHQEVEAIDAYIGIWASENTRAMTQVDPRVQAQRSKAQGPLLEAFLKRAADKGTRQLRWVGTQFPCHASAQDAEMSLFEYANFVFSAGLLHLEKPDVAWRKIGQAQQRLADYLMKGRELRYVAANGTDIRFGIEGRRWINCDGHHNFPDGEVFTGPIEDATEGEVRFSFPAVYEGREVTDAWLRFAGGRVVEAGASKGEDYLFRMMDQDEGGRILGEVAIGTNYAIQAFTRNTLFDEKIGGTVHMALGAAYPESGGKNKSALHWDMVCDLRKSGRIELDGKVILENGRFKRPTWPQP